MSGTGSGTGPAAGARTGAPRAAACWPARAPRCAGATDPAGVGGGSAGRFARRAGRGALAASGVSVTLLAAVMALGPSAAVPAVGPGGPMWWLPAHPSAGTVIVLERSGLLLGALATATGLAAVAAGWRPSARLLLGFGAVVAAVFVILPPAGSIDVLNYAIYGRIAGLGHNPYLIRPAELLHSGDPVGRYAPANWRTLPTVYGPVATAAQWAAAKLGGGSMARIVFWIRLGNALAYLATSAALLRLAGRDPARRARACLLWAANPVMLFWLVGSGHVDVLLALLTTAALLTAGRGAAARATNGAGGAGSGPVHGRGGGQGPDAAHGPGGARSLLAGAGTGVLAGAAIAVKAPFALAAAGLAWSARKSPAKVAAGGLGAAAVLIPCYLLPGAAGVTALGRRLTVSAGFIYPVPAAVAARPAIFAAAVLTATVVVALTLAWRLPPGDPRIAAVRPMLVLAIAWVAVFPVQAPWYDALIFPLLALMPPSRLDYLLVTRSLLLSEMLLPGTAPNTGQWSILAARLSHAGLLVLLATLIVMCAANAWHTVPAGGRPGRPGPPASPVRP